ncbi:Vacuolar protein sorting-associated protein Ist1 [Sesbania bispinosa]|nr:Vacuolar protein sorting-associated protein Ist1 [Sesbania bispinosa]
MRLEIVQKRRTAVQKFLKSDIAELLRRGLDYDAYNRAEGLLFEQNMLSCYELIAKFVGCISDHVLDLTKQKDCPDECKEAVPSLMYAAARIGDLPELRELRTLFTEKFGNSLEPYTSKELVEKLRRDPPTAERKIRLLYDIAQEFSIEWDGTDNVVTGGDGTGCNTSKGKERDTMSLGRKDFSDDSVRYQSSSDDDTNSEALPKKESNQYLHQPVVKQKTTSRSTRRRRVKSRPGGEDSVSDAKTYDAATIDSGGTKSGKGKAYPSPQPEYDIGQNRMHTTHVRGTSLPSKPTTAVEETSKGHTRTYSLNQEMRGSAGHVHPNLPDYDDLVERLAALRRRS